MKIFNIKNGIKQFGQTREKIEGKFPLLGSIIISVFIIIKWLITIALIIAVIILIVYCAISLPSKKYQVEVDKAYEDCVERCNPVPNADEQLGSAPASYLKQPYMTLTERIEQERKRTITVVEVRNILEVRGTYNNCIFSCRGNDGEHPSWNIIRPPLR